MTTFSGWGFDYGALLADVDMNAHQYKFVMPASTAGKFAVCTGASKVALGVLQDDPQSGMPGTIRMAGTTLVTGSGAISFGNLIKAASNGCASAISTSGLAQGVALTALASGSGLIEVFLFPGTFVSAGS